MSPIEAQLAYWRTQLCGSLPTLELPSDRPRPAVQTFRGAQQPVMLPAPLTAALAGLGQRTQVIRFMTLLAAFATLLARYTEQEELLVGAPVANRTQRAVEGLIGLFANTLVLRIDLSGNPRFHELLARVREMALEAYAHQDLPFEQLVEALHPARDMSRNPLVQVMFVLQEAPLPTQEVAGLQLQAQVIDGGTAQFDLALHLAEREEALVGWFEYNCDLFDAATVARLAGHWRTLLEGVVADPPQRLAGLPLLTAAERQQVLVDWNATSAATPQSLTYRELNERANRLAHHLRALGVGPEVPVAICMERSPELLIGLLGVLKAGGAYVPLDPNYPHERLDFMLEDARAAVLLTTTDDQRPTTDDRRLTTDHRPTTISDDRSTYRYDISYPNDDQRRPTTTDLRLQSKIQNPKSKIVHLDADWPTIARASADDPTTPVAVQNLAYAIYTSGSTGVPKAVEVPHVGLLNLIAWHQRTYGLTADDRAMQFAGIGFDAMCWEIWPYLTIGASLALPGAEVRLTPARLQEWLVAQRITIAFLPTPLAEAAVALAWPEMCTLRALLTGGDQLHHYPTSGLGFTLVNHYGPTEATVVTTAAPVPASPTTEMLPPIGRPIANMQVYVLDRQLQPVPIGIPGELHIGGIGLAGGYRNRPELTAERFVPNPFVEDKETRRQGGKETEDAAWATQNSKRPEGTRTQNLRLYRTGDLARYRSDGNLEFLGRIDQQVKLRGFRIEVGEIEAMLGQHPAVRERVVVAREDVPGEKRLVAYVVTSDKSQVTSSADSPLVTRHSLLVTELRSFLKERLPDYMVPSAFVTLDALPLTPSGKIDRRALPEPGDLRSQLEAPYVAPQTAMEQAIAGVWKAVLQVDQVGLHDNFFDLGGHSLLMAQLHGKLQESLGLNISMIDLFTHPTISAIAQHVHQGQDQPALFQERPAQVEARSESLRQRRRLLQTYWETEHNEEEQDE